MLIEFQSKDRIVRTNIIDDVYIDPVSCGYGYAVKLALMGGMDFPILGEYDSRDKALRIYGRVKWAMNHPNSDTIWTAPENDDEWWDDLRRIEEDEDDDTE